MQNLVKDNINTESYWDTYYKWHFGEGNNLERNAFWLHWFPTHLDIRVLEIGYGSDKGIIKAVKDRPNVKMTALDFSSALIERDVKSYPWIEFSCISILNYIPAQKFDIVICQHVLEHFDNPQSLVDRVSEKVLLPGGFFLLSLPHWGSFRSPEHVKAFTLVDILDLTDKDFYLLNVSIIDCGVEGQEMRFVLGKKGNGK